MHHDPRSLTAEAARRLVECLAGVPLPESGVRVVAEDEKRICLVLVWEAGRRMPTVVAQVQGERAACRQDILNALRDAGRPLTRRQVVRALRERGTPHGPGTVAKALAELTAAGQLLNPRDRRGYRLADWPKGSHTPDLFE